MLQTKISTSLAPGIDFDRSLQTCAQTLAQQLDIASLHLWILEEDTLELLLQAGSCSALDHANSRICVGQFSIGRIAATHQPYLTNGLREDPSAHGPAWVQREGLLAFAGYPLLIGDRLEGVVALFDRKPLRAETLDALAACVPIIARAVLRNRLEKMAIKNGRLISRRERDLMNSQQAMVIQAPDGRIIDWNAGAVQLFAYRREEVIGMRGTLLVPHDALDDYEDMMQRLGRGEEVARSEAVRLQKNGKRIHVRLTASPLHDGVGAVIATVTVLNDFAVIECAEQKYQQAQKMETFSQLARGVAHDFNNLLTVVLGYGDVLLNRLEPTDQSYPLLLELRRAAERGESLTRQLLSFGRMQVAEPKVLDLHVVIAETEPMVRRLVGDNCPFTTFFTSNLWLVKADFGQVQQVLLNLVVNARDAMMPQGGRITIETANIVATSSSGPGVLRPHPGKYVMLSVQDEGIGMTGAIMERIFEPFFTTREGYQGTGLGLTTVDAIVKQSGGYLEVESELGMGSTFKVYLPQVQESSYFGKPHLEPQLMPRGDETLLVVEDEEAVRRVMCKILTLCGYTVLEAKNGEEACRIAQSHQGQLHMLVSDVVMPHLGGRALADRLLEQDPELKVLFLSGYPMETVIEQGVWEPEFAFLQKPATIQTLATKVRAVLDER